MAETPPQSGEGDCLPATFAKIALRAGVSRTTVHRALHEGRVSESTKARVRRAAEELGYRENPLVRSLMTQVRAARVQAYRGALAYVAAAVRRENPVHPTVRRFLAGARLRAGQRGFGLEVFYPLADRLDPARLTAILHSRGIRGAVISAFPFSLRRRPSQLGPEDLPLVPDTLACASIGGWFPEPGLPFATHDQYFSGRTLARALEARGYRRPGLVIDPLVNDLTESRFQAGFLSLDSFDKPRTEVPSLIAFPDQKQALLAWFKAHRPDVVVASFPETLEHLRAAGADVPKTVGFATFDHDPARPEIAGIDQRHEEVGAAAVDLVVERLDLNEIGVPRFARGVEIEGVFVGGDTLRAENVAPGVRA